jgi:hypothetical protein
MKEAISDSLSAGEDMVNISTCRMSDQTAKTQRSDQRLLATRREFFRSSSGGQL